MKKEANNEKKIMWYTLALMAFSTVWGFGNVINGFAVYGGLRSIVPWIMVFVLYFVPYALMVGELGSAFRNAEGGVSSWVHETIGPRMAFYAGWTYWIVHMPYISQKPTTALIAAGWVIFGDGRVSQISAATLHLGGLVLFSLCLYMASRGLSWIKKIASAAGTSMFVMSILFILMMLAAPAVTSGQGIQPITWSWDSFRPSFDLKFWMNMSILILAVGGCEKISPYVNKMKDPGHGFPKGMIALAVMVMICAVLGTLALGMIVDSSNIPDDFMTNGAYFAFQKVGEFYGVGNLLMIIYAIAYFIGQVSVIIVSIDAPLRILLDSADSSYIPPVLMKKNKYGVYINGYWLIAIIVSILLILPVFGIGSVNQIVKYLIRLNAICMPLRYLWVFAAYVAMRRRDCWDPAYRFVKNRWLGMAAGAWCFVLTAYSCISGILNAESAFELFMNILTPFILLGLGFLLPLAARRKQQQSIK
ncbi:amino acid permease [Ructibacterium gallinarum]|uniref:Amino acid permease n=1 Tax=Ructibacterium gallinarum TaxID=2779355 RepID=A0A9D5M3H9_9FIRM|nr:amino acid permease [Ructibacterium gallinarum]MBE5039935.1 amino acid permease [Ructibacterium gallinarum]